MIGVGHDWTAAGLSTRYGDVTRAVLESYNTSAPAGSDLWRVVEGCEHDAKGLIL
jgi:hypothetical protein